MKRADTIFLLLLLATGIRVSAKIVYVGPSEEYTAIKWAYNNVSAGDTIIVKNGYYPENARSPWP